MLVSWPGACILPRTSEERVSWTLLKEIQIWFRVWGVERVAIMVTWD